MARPKPISGFPEFLPAGRIAEHVRSLSLTPRVFPQPEVQ